MELRILDPKELERVYETDLKSAFPPSELKPLRAMESLRAAGLYDPLGLFDEAGEPLGCILLWKHGDGRYVLIDYLCVPAGKRNGGVGGNLLRAAAARYPAGTVLLAESEAPSGDPERDGIILRRLGFYARNGAKTLGYQCALFGVRYRVLCWADPMPGETEILQKHRELYLRQFGRERYERYVQLPLLPGEPLGPVLNWEE